MKKTSKFILPAFVAAFALAFVVATPYVMAESGYGMHSFDGAKSHKGHWAIQVEGFEGTIQITEDVDKKTLKDKVTVSLSEASAGLDVQKASLGVAVNENGEKYLVWKLVSIITDSESGTATKTINIVDAGDVDNTALVTKEFDKSSHQDKWAHYKDMKGKFADITPEEREAKFAQYKEMKEAFASISEEDKETIMSHFKDMKGHFADLTQEEIKAKHTELKQQMEAFMELSLDEKTNYLKNLAMSFRNQA